MRRTISLDGTWQRNDFLDEAWRWSDALRPSASDEAAAGGPPIKAGVSAGWRPGQVPGSTIDDAWRMGEIPNPYIDRNSLGAEWIPQRRWVYRRRLIVPPEGPGRTLLRFGGLDPGGTVFVDGEEVARHDGMFVPLEVDLGERLAPGSEHDLVVVLDAAPAMPSQVGHTELVDRHRARMGYGWDFCPRLVHTGIWREVSIELRERAWLTRPLVVVDIDDDRGTARIDAIVHGESSGTRLVARLHDPHGRSRSEASAEVRTEHASVVLEVDGPDRWWPNGAGVAHLHQLELRLEADGDVLDTWERRIGFRRLELRQGPGVPVDSRPYQMVVNGRPMPIRGWNWVPLDALYGVQRLERLRHLVELARRANVNMLRVWGGGLIESEAFYDACDAAGILVWQEFVQSSSGVTNAPSDEPSFVDHMAREARAIIPLRAHHPSLALWCGGNELSDAEGLPLTEAHPVLRVLQDEVRRADPGRGWLPTSPSGPRFDNTLDAIAEDPDSLHDVHGPWEHQGLAEQHALANATTNLLHSEFGVEGMTNPETLRVTITDPALWTADRSDPVLAHRGAWWNNRPFVERLFGPDLSLEELARASQHLQADGLRTLIEGDRRRWPRAAGMLPWVFNEPFPNAWSNAAVDYFGRPKAAYHAVAEAYAPVAVGTTFASQALDGATTLEATGWVANELDRPLEGTLTLALHDATGRRLAGHAGPLTVAPLAIGGGSPSTLKLEAGATDLLILDATFSAADEAWTSRRLLSRTSTLEPMRHLPPTALDASVAVDGDRWCVSLSVIGGTAAVELRLDDARPVGWPEPAGAPYLDANVVTLLPGEDRQVGVDWCDVPVADRGLRLSGWNVAACEVRGG